MPRTGSATERGIGAVKVLYLLLLFVVMVGERLVRHVLLP